ncbi:DUF551 domain-containing protein [Escherichia coli]|uniref:DUF551 domain-containing protein n=1 Tax=Escherichia coli TaxID=562 RepID=UPI0037DDB166
MTTFTKEQLISHARESVSYLGNLKGRVSKEGADCKVVLEMVERDLELARIALASIEAKPIGAFHIAEQQVDGTSDYLKDGEWPIDNGIIEVYAAPPAPVPLTEVQRAMLRDMDVEISAELEEEEEIYRDGIRKCIAALRYHHKRAETCSNGYTGSTLEEDTLKSINFLKRNNIAAMLQAEPVSNSDELPLDYLQGHKDGLEWAAQLAEANNPQTGDWLYDDPIDLARAIRKGPDMPTVQGGNSPVTPDGWISCSERMPAQDDWILIYSKHGEYMAGQVQEEYVELSDGTLSWLGNALFWMPLPEPPQESQSE